MQVSCAALTPGSGTVLAHAERRDHHAGRRPLEGQVHRCEAGRMPGSWLLEEVEALTLEH